MPANPFARGFSIVEVIVVIVIIAILSGLVVPRMVAGSSRSAELEAKEVRMMLTTLAQRDAISGQRLALDFDKEKNRLSILVQNGENDPAAGAPITSGSGPAPIGGDWKPAPLIRPLTFAYTAITQFTLDGTPVAASLANKSVRGPGSWRIEVDQNQKRPAMSLLIAAADDADKRAFQIDLLPGQTAAAIKYLTSSSQWTPVATEAIDLDATGMRETPW